MMTSEEREAADEAVNVLYTFCLRHADSAPYTVRSRRCAMAKRSSIRDRARKVETRVAKYLWGADACRDWKEDHDLSGEDADGNRWVGEVKSHAWPAGPRALWTKLEAALDQAQGYWERSFAVLVPVGASIGDALVMYVAQGQRVVITLEQFRVNVLGPERQEGV